MSLGFGIKELRFSWPAVSGADYYRMLENPDGTSGYTQVGANLTTLSVNHTIPLHRRLNASYIVEACNSAGCTGSKAQILGANLVQAIGYVKASLAGSYNYFGASVALSGDGNTLAVGVQNCDGTCARDTVYVYTRSAGTWSQQATVTALNPGPDQFGHSLALSDDGNTLAVGAPYEDSRTTGVNGVPNELEANAGAAYVFARSGTAWSQQAFVKAATTFVDVDDLFGRSVSLSGEGNTLAVGGRVDTCGDACMANAVFLYTRTGATWSPQASVMASNHLNSDIFGHSVALSSDGNTLAVGAPYEDSSTVGVNTKPNELAADAGAVYVFTRSGTIWSQQAYVKASNTGAGDNFGYSVALSGDGNTLAVGAINESSSSTGIGGTSDNLAAGAGAVYVFTRSGANWLEQVYVKASNTGAGDYFGISVALAGDGNTLAVGAAYEDSSITGIGSTPNEAAADAGAVYVFTRNAGIWSQKAYVKASNAGAGDNFGISVTLSGDGNTLAVGAPYEDSSTNGIGSTPNDSATNAGAVYLY